MTRRANRKKRLTVLYIVEHPNQEGDTCIDWTSQYCWTNGWNCLWRGHSVYRNRPLIPLKTSKKWVSSGGGLGGSGPKTHWRMPFLDKIMILQGVKLTIQPLGVGYANRPKQAQNGGYVAFSPIYACLALI